MKKLFVMGVLGMSMVGCTASQQVWDNVKNPPVHVLDCVKLIGEWLAGFVLPWIKALVGTLLS